MTEVNPTARVLRVIRRVIELTARDGLLTLTSFWKEPGNFYFVLVPVALLPRFDDLSALEDHAAYQEIWQKVVWTPNFNVIAAYSPHDGAWGIPAWASSTRHGRSVISSDPSEPIEVSARRWVRSLDRGWLRSWGVHPETDAELILEWLDRVIVVVDADPTATVTFRPMCALSQTIVEIHGEGTSEEIWWRNYAGWSWRW